MKTVLVDKENTGEIVSCLQKENVVAFPTETVFGLGIVFNSTESLEKLYELKGREKSKAITLMVANKEEIPRYAMVSEKSQKVIDSWMPGKLTLILKKQSIIDDAFTANKPTIGIRIPDDPFVLRLLQEVGPMWVTSANVSGMGNISSDIEVYEQFKNTIPMIVRGKTNSKIASTVVDMQNDDMVILRQGNITIEMLKETIKDEDSSSL